MDTRLVSRPKNATKLFENPIVVALIRESPFIAGRRRETKRPTDGFFAPHGGI